MLKNKITQEHKSKSNLCTYVLVACALALVSCAQQHEVVTGQICVPGVGKAKTMEVAEDVVAQMHFAIEKADAKTGYIRTRPLPGAQFFELWRCDNIGADNWLQANLRTIRRTVELQIARRGQELCIGCDVRVQSLSLPEREVSSSAWAYEMFSKSSPSLQRLELHPEQQRDMVWIDLGRDGQLETEILKRIEERLVLRTSNESPAGEDET